MLYVKNLDLGALCDRNPDPVHVSDALQQVPDGHPDVQVPGCRNSKS